MNHYSTLLIDPPWRYRGTLPGFATDRTKRSKVPYQTLGVDEIAGLPVGKLAAPDAHLYFWVTSTHLPYAFDIIKAWGFHYSTPLVWVKPPRGAAGFPTYANCVEFCLFCRRGKLRPKRRWDRNWFEWKRQAHSAKPEAFIDMVEQVSPGPYLEIFSRRHRLQWDVMGDGMSGLDIREEMAAFLGAA